MKINYLWHSEFLIQIKNSNDEEINILSDTWLSNYAFGDMMMRNPSVKIDFSKIKIDAIFISHSHCDHFDPYFLTEIYNNIKPRPILLVPETISFLVPIFKKYLPKQQIEILKSKKTFNFKWIDITGIVFENDYITNEDDVMTIAISNEKEMLYSDVDTVPPENEESINLLYDLFTQKNYESRVYLSTRNELEWNFKIIQTNDINKRKTIYKEYLEQRKEEIEYNYARFEEDFFECSDIQELPYFSKWLIWQWIIHPEHNFLALRVLKLQDEAILETKIAKKYGRNINIVWLIPWKVYENKWKNLIEIWDINFLSHFNYFDREDNIELDITKEEIIWPLDDRNTNQKWQEQKILNYLNNKFLPYRMWNTEDNLKNVILTSPHHKYVIKIKYWNKDNYFERNYYFDFACIEFREELWEHKYWSEDYWANDIEDFLEWRQELYSNFWHKLTPKKAYRLWTCMWANFINNDILYKKYELHFKRASIWETSDSFVKKILDKLEQQKTSI